MKLSIIIPVYNTESYLKRCLDSIFNQDLPPSDYEVIVINDGSTDHSLNILKDYEKRYDNIVLINQKNQGVSVARNEGLKIAKGEYVTFVDSDDFINVNVLKTIISRAENDNLDLLYLTMNAVSEEGDNLDSNYMIGVDGVVQDGFNHPRRTYPPTLYKKQLIGDIRFSSNIIIGEDTVFNAKVQANAKRCSYFSFPYYKYTIRANSASKQGMSEKAYVGFENALIELAQFEEEVSQHTLEEKNYFNRVYHIFITRILEHNILPSYSKEKYNTLVSTVKKHQKKHLLQLQDEKYPYFSSNFNRFKLHQKILKCKSKIYRLLFK